MAKINSQLSNDNILLRKPEPEDLDFLYSLENDTNIWWVSDTRSPFSRWQIKQHIENSVYDIYTNKELRLIITDKHNGKALGVIDLFQYEPAHQRAGVGIVILQEYRNQKIAEQSLEIIIEYCFNIINLNKIWCCIDAKNLISIKLFKKFGFVKTGELKEWKKIGENKFEDVYLYQLKAMH